VSGGMVFITDDTGVISAYAEPDLAAAIGPVTSGSLNVVAPVAQPSDPFTIVRTLDPSTTGLTRIESFDVGPDGLIYVLDLKPSVTVIDPATGKVVRTWGRQGNGEGEFNLRVTNGNPGTGDIAVGKDGTVFVADGSNHRVQVFTPDGTFIRQMGSWGSQDGQFQATRLIAVDAEGSVYVGDDPTGALTKFGPDGAFVWRNPGGSQGTGPTVQLPDGRIVSLGDAGVATLDPATGEVVDRWGTPGFRYGQLSNMCYVTADAADNEYIFSCAPDRTQIFDSDHRLIGGVYSTRGQQVFIPKFGPSGEVYATDWFASDNIYILKDSLLKP
jgi:DNA-binding beta-propeller fold protein YncE